MSAFGPVPSALRAFRRLPPLPADTFSHSRTSSWRYVTFALLMISAGEAVLVHVLLGAWLTDPTVVQAIVAAAHVYGMLWLLGDGRALRETGHRVGPEGLHIQLGGRWTAMVPWSTVTAVRVGEVAEPDRLVGERRPAHQVSVTPLETPDVTLTLSAPVTLNGPYGIQRTGTELLLRLDDPAAFAAAVEAHITPSEAA